MPAGAVAGAEPVVAALADPAADAVGAAVLAAEAAAEAEGAADAAALALPGGFPPVGCWATAITPMPKVKASAPRE